MTFSNYLLHAGQYKHLKDAEAHRIPAAMRPLNKAAPAPRKITITGKGAMMTENYSGLIQDVLYMVIPLQNNDFCQVISCQIKVRE